MELWVTLLLPPKEYMETKPSFTHCEMDTNEQEKWPTLFSLDKLALTSLKQEAKGGDLSRAKPRHVDVSLFTPSCLGDIFTLLLGRLVANHIKKKKVQSTKNFC